MSGYAFHPDAFAELDEIWAYIAQDNIDAADRVSSDRIFWPPSDIKTDPSCLRN